MKAVFFSDTHNLFYRDYSHFEGADVVFFCGDMSNRGTKEEVERFVSWFSKMPVKNKVCVAGNHDFFFEEYINEISVIESVFNGKGIVYLNDQFAEVDGLKVWGSPIQPWFHDWAFNRYPGADIAKHWDKIPEGLDVLITHGPPHGIMDQAFGGDNCGCPQLLNRVLDVRPRVHAFGHIHEGHGTIKLSEFTPVDESQSDIIFVNAATAIWGGPTRGYTVLMDPIAVEL